MNEALVHNWNSVVAPEDSVYVIGDFSLSFRAVEIFTEKLNGIKHLVPGNHDFCSSAHPKSKTPEKRQNWVKKYEDLGWIVLPEEYVLETESYSLTLCHFPKTVDFSPDKYAKFRPKTDGYLIHGHTHSKKRMKGKEIHVGVDAWGFYPVSLCQILEMIDSAMVKL